MTLNRYAARTDANDRKEWAVWLVNYAQYWEIERYGDHPSIQCTAPMTLEKALAEAERCGFGYCVKPIA